jgi:hypothetical protein
VPIVDGFEIGTSELISPENNSTKSGSKIALLKILYYIFVVTSPYALEIWS